MKIFLCPAWQILIIRNIFPPWEQIKTFQIQQSFEKSLHSANCQRCVKATLTLLLIYFRGIIRVIMKIEMREIKFSWGVIAWDFLLIFYFIKIESKWLGKVSFRAKNQKDMLDDGTYSRPKICIIQSQFTQILASHLCLEVTSKNILGQYV